MGTKTTRLDLTKPGENDYYNQQTEQADNWQKVDDYAVYTDRDKNAIWGGLDGGGLIEDPSVTKVVGKRYIGADGKAYICLVPSNINNSTNYTPCNVVDNLDKLQNLFKVKETNIIELNETTLLVSVDFSVAGGQIKDFVSSYGFAQKYISVSVLNFLNKMPINVFLLGSNPGAKGKNGPEWTSGTASSIGYKNGAFHLYLLNTTANFIWQDQAVSFSFIAKY